MQTIIHNLRKKGCKVRVGHWRYIKNPFISLMPPEEIKEIKIKKQSDNIFAKGGRTKMEVTFPNAGTYASRAFCNLTDSFNRKIALNICLGRIRKQLEKAGRNDLLAFFK